MQKGPQDNKKESDSEEDLSEAKLDEFLDWRSKKSWRQQNLALIECWECDNLERMQHEVKVFLISQNMIFRLKIKI